MSIFYRTALYL